MEDVLGKALLDYYHGYYKHKLWIYNKYGRKEEMPVSTYFRSVDEMSELELLAVEACNGNILDIGAGTGSHTILLQQRNFNVYALDSSCGAVQVMHERGVRNTINKNILQHTNKKYSTLLLLMNGMGIAATINGLKALLHHCKLLLTTHGQIIFDSSDVAYLYKNQNLPEHYYGEIDYRYKYKRWLGEWFKWLYIDKQTMQQVAADFGLKLEILLETEFGQYLGKLKRNSK